MDFTGIMGSWELADRLNKAGVGLDAWMLDLDAGQGALVDWEASDAGRLLLVSGLGVELLRGEWVPIAGPSVHVHSTGDTEAVLCMDYRLVWAETPEGSWEKTYDSAHAARVTFTYVVAALTYGTQTLSGVRRYLDGTHTGRS